MFLQISVRRLSFCRGSATLPVGMVAAILLSAASVSLAAEAQKAPSAQPANDPKNPSQNRLGEGDSPQFFSADHRGDGAREKMGTVPSGFVTGSNAQAMWVDHIEPILSKNCFRCHGAEKQKGGLDLRVTQSIMAGGTDGSVVTPGRPEDSPLFQRIQPDSDEHMPPDKGHQLNAEEISFVKQWIALLPIPGHPAPGSSKEVNWSQVAPSLMNLATRTKWSPPAGMKPTDAIDHLIEATWQAQNVSGSGLCDDATFVRRIYLDLVGRIPTVAEARSVCEIVRRAEAG